MFKNNKLVVVLSSVIVLLLLFIFMQFFFFQSRLVETKLNLITVTNFEKVGFDWDGDKLSSSMLFSWEIEPFRTVWEEPEFWGREGSWMPNILTAVDSEGFNYFGQIDHFGRTNLTTLFVFNVQCFFSFSSTLVHS